MFTTGYGFIIDYLSEAMHSLRELDFTGKYKEYFTLSSTISTRDRDGVQKTFSGLMKVLHPSGEATKDEIKELLKLSMEARKRVKDQLFRIDPTYDPVDFSFTDNETGEKISVKTLEEVEYPALYYRNGEQPEEAVVVDESVSETDSETVADEMLKSDTSALEGVVEVVENQRGIDYHGLFAAHIEGAKNITITDPFIRNFYQARNLMEFMEMILRLKKPEDGIKIRLRTSADEHNFDSQKSYLEQIKESCSTEGIDFDYVFEEALHDRNIVTDTGWFITLGRGLDIFQPCDLKNAFLFTSRIQTQRNCKPFTITFVKKNL
jgi:ATP-dependent Lon protease